MRILTRYILGEILSHTLIGCALFTFILFMPYLPHILEMVVRNSSTFSNAAEIFLFTLPNLFRVTIPMSVLVGILLGLSRLAADSEIIAMRASGLGIGYFVRVSSIVAVGGTLLGLANSLYLAPRANQAILDMEQSLETSQASYQIQPRVFYEDFKNFVLYVQNVRSGTGASNWDQVFMADVTDPEAPRITTAASATVVSDSTQVLLMRLRNGAQHDPVAGQPDQYNDSVFTTTDRPLELERAERRAPRPPGHGHLRSAHGRLCSSASTAPTPSAILIELQQPLRLSRRLPGAHAGRRSARRRLAPRRQKLRLRLHHSAGLLYYFLSLIGTALGRQNKLSRSFSRSGPPTCSLPLPASSCSGRWPAAGAFSAPSTVGSPVRPSRHPTAAPQKVFSLTGLLDKLQRRPQRAKSRHAFPRILDEYVVREFLGMFLLVLAGFVLLMLVFTFFDLVGDILRNHIPLTMVGDYLVNLTPDMLYQIAPLAVLIATLVTFGVLNRNSEIIAMKATGISLYRLVVPIVSISAILVHQPLPLRPVLSAPGQPPAGGPAQHHQGPPAADRCPPRAQLDLRPAPSPASPAASSTTSSSIPTATSSPTSPSSSSIPPPSRITRRIFAARVFWDADTGAWRFENGWVRDIDRRRHRTPSASSRRPPSPRFTKTPATSQRKTCNPRR